jgi:hypothetical protein
VSIGGRRNGCKSCCRTTPNTHHKQYLKKVRHASRAFASASVADALSDTESQDEPPPAPARRDDVKSVAPWHWRIDDWAVDLPATLAEKWKKKPHLQLFDPVEVVRAAVVMAKETTPQMLQVKYGGGFMNVSLSASHRTDSRIPLVPGCDAAFAAAGTAQWANKLLTKSTNEVLRVLTTCVRFIALVLWCCCSNKSASMLTHSLKHPQTPHHTPPNQHRELLVPLEEARAIFPCGATHAFGVYFVNPTFAKQVEAVAQLWCVGSACCKVVNECSRVVIAFWLPDALILQKQPQSTREVFELKHGLHTLFKSCTPRGGHSITAPVHVVSMAFSVPDASLPQIVFEAADKALQRRIPTKVAYRIVDKLEAQTRPELAPQAVELAHALRAFYELNNPAMQVPVLAAMG